MSAQFKNGDVNQLFVELVAPLKSGKAIMAEAFLYEMEEGQSPYKIPFAEKFILEEEASDASWDVLSKSFESAGNPFRFDFTTMPNSVVHFRGLPEELECEANKRAYDQAEASITYIRGKDSQGLQNLVFLSHKVTKYQGYNFMGLKVSFSPEGIEIKWRIEFDDNNLNLANIENALSIIQNFNQNRQKRLGGLRPVV